MALAGGEAAAQDKGSSGDSDLDSILGSAPPAPAPAAPAAAPQEAAPPPAATAPPKPGEAVAAPKPPVADDSGALVVQPQDQPKGSTAAVHNRVVEEIVVTAQKREENIQDVPISIQAFSGDALAARGVVDTSGLQQTVPSLQFTNQAGFTLIFLRGIGTDNPIPSADRDVATYVDGIFMPSGQSTMQALGQVQRVEVLKGPQGTLFGRNSTGGAISVITEDPGQDFKGSVEAEASRFSGTAAKFAVMSPVTSWLSASLSGSIDRQDSYYTDVNYPIQPSRHDAARFKLSIHPSDKFKLVLTVFHSDDKDAYSEIAENTSPSLLGTLLGITAQPSNYIAHSDFPAQAKSTQDMLYGNFTWNLPWFDVKMIGGQLVNRTPYTSFDFDGSPIPLVGFDGSNEYTHQQTGELQLVSNADSWLADRLKWTLGFYYFHSAVAIDPAHIHVAANAINAILNLAGASEPAALENLFQNLGLENTPLGTEGLRLAFAGGLGTKSYSAYAQATYNLTDWLDLTLGGRYQWERRYLIESSTSLIAPITDQTVPIFEFPLTHAVALNFSPKVMLSMHPSDTSMVYASYSVGYKSGTFNLVNIYTPPNYIVPEKISTYEAGVKSEFLDGRLRLNGAVFYNKIRDLQTSFISLLSGGALRFETAPAARTLGGEVDGTFVPLPEWDPGLALTGNAAYVKANYTDFPDGSGFAPGTGLFQSNQDFTGNRMVYAPTVSGSIGLVQTIETANGSWELSADNYYNSGFFADSANIIKQSGYTVQNARISYLYNPWNMRLTLFGTNLADHHYFRQQFPSDFGVLTALSAPREYGIRLHWDFGS
jgi:iron complex outermembrane receptor protein